MHTESRAEPPPEALADSAVYVVLSGWVEWGKLFGAEMTAEGGIPFQVQTPNDSIGFVPVYATREQAQAVVDRLGRPAYIASFTRKGAIL